MEDYSAYLALELADIKTEIDEELAAAIIEANIAIDQGDMNALCSSLNKVAKIQQSVEAIAELEKNADAIASYEDPER